MFYFNRFLAFTIILFVSIVIASCSSSKSRNDKQLMDTVIAKDTMVLLLIDLHLAEGIVKKQYSNHPHANYYSKFYFEQILQKFNANAAKFQSSIRYYTQHSAVFDEIYEKVITKLNEIHDVKNETVNLHEHSATSTDTTGSKPIGLPKIFEILKNKPGH